jgi:hypothetical protein
MHTRDGFLAMSIFNIPISWIKSGKKHSIIFGFQGIEKKFSLKI